MFLKVNNFLCCCSLERGCYVIGYAFAVAYGVLALFSLTGLVWLFSMDQATSNEREFTGWTRKVWKFLRNMKCDVISDLYFFLLLVLILAVPLWYAAVQFIKGIKNVSNSRFFENSSWITSLLLQQKDHIQMSMFALALIVQIVVTLIAMFFVHHRALIFLGPFEIFHYYILVCVLSLCENMKEESPLVDENCYHVNIVAAFEKAQVRVWTWNFLQKHRS